MKIYANITHCHVNLEDGRVNPKSFRNKQRKIRSFGPRERPTAQVVARRPQITLSTIQGEQSAKSSFSSGLWQQCCGKSWQSRSLPCQVLVTAPFSLRNTKVTQTLFHKEGAKRQAQSRAIFHCVRGNVFTFLVCLGFCLFGWFWRVFCLFGFGFLFL